MPQVLIERARKLTAEHEQLKAKLNGTFDSVLAKRAAEIGGVASAFREWEAAQSSIEELGTLMQSNDTEMRELAQEELETMHEQVASLNHKLSVSLTPKDPYADLPCTIELRPGPGGIEGRFFTDSLFQMYQLYCQRKGYRTKVIQFELADGIGMKGADGEQALQEAVLEILEPGSYDIFRNEAGIHRVQRVPVTENKGRTHTSAVAVWVLPTFPETGGDDINNPESDFYIDPAEVRTETMRARGAGGQHVNKTESAIRLTHLPTGIQVSMQDERSQQMNRVAAWKTLRSRLAAMRRVKREEEAAALKDNVLSKSQITRGDKIRTYNYAQDRVSDHRSGLDTTNLPNVLMGGERLDKVMESAREWRLGKDLEAVIAEEEMAAAGGGKEQKKGKK